MRAGLADFAELKNFLPVAKKRTWAAYKSGTEKTARRGLPIGFRRLSGNICRVPAV